MTTLLWIKRIAYGWIAFGVVYELATRGLTEAIYALIVWSVLFGILYGFTWLMWRFFSPPPEPGVSTTDANEFGDR